MTEQLDDNFEGQQQPSRTVRLVLSLAITAYLGIVLLGPLSNPIGSQDLTIPLARKVAPVHQALFLGHGYRFFGPDPGASHIFEYRIESDSAADPIVGKFPDRDVHKPRLRYHRWFMLSESIYEDQVQLIEDAEFEQIAQQLSAEAEEVRVRGELHYARDLIRERELLLINQTTRIARTNHLKNELAQFLLKKHGGERIELFLLERLIADPNDIASRFRLNHPRFLSEPRSIGKFTVERPGELEVIE